MIFRRTANGIANLHLFFGVDRVVYCEGGKPIPLEAIGKGDGDDTTLDVMFWSNVIKNLSGNKKCHFKSVGSKAVLKSLEDDIVQGNITTIILCRDTDFDDLLGRKKTHPFLLYTYGYSWENDIVRQDIVLEVFRSYLPSDAATERIAETLVAAIQRLNTYLKRWCEIDVTLISKQKGALFVRSSPIALFNGHASKPTVDKARVKGRLGGLGYKRCPPRKYQLPDDDSLRYACGKTVAGLIYQLTAGHIVKRDATVRLSSDTFYRNCINETFKAIGRGQCVELASYFDNYKSAFE